MEVAEYIELITQKSEHANHKYYCTDCDKEFSKLLHLMKHHQSVHDDKRYPCDQCDYQAKNKGYLSIQFIQDQSFHVMRVTIKLNG